MLDLISQVKRTHQNTGVSAFKMQAERTGSVSWLALFVIIGIPTSFPLWGGYLIFREYRPPLCVTSHKARGGTGSGRVVAFRGWVTPGCLAGDMVLGSCWSLARPGLEAAQALLQQGRVSRTDLSANRQTLAGFGAFLGMGMANHTALKLMNPHAILTRMKTVAKLTYRITPKPV